MQLIGSFCEFSWYDLLDLVAHKCLTGWLCVEAVAEGATQGRRQYQVWFQNGSLVAAAQSGRRHGSSSQSSGDSNHNSLLWMMQRQGWLSPNVSQKMAQQCPPQVPLGQYFRQQRALDDRQLQQLFNLQLSPVIKALSLLESAQFQLDTTMPLPLELMTGLKLPAYNAQTLARQRAIAKSPAPQMALVNAGRLAS